MAEAEAQAHARGEPGQENARVRAEEEPSADDATPKARAKRAQAQAEENKGRNEGERNSAGKIKHTHIAAKAIEAAFAAFGGDPADHGTIQQALLHAQRDLRANFRHHKAKYAGGK